MNDFEQFLEFINDKVILLKDDEILEIKPKVVKMLGYSNKRKLVGNTYRTLIDAELDLTSNGPMFLPYILQNQSTERIKTTVYSLQQEDVMYTALKVNNIDFHSDEVKKLEQLETQFNALISHSPFYILIVDSENNLSFINQVGDYYTGKDITKNPMTSLLQPEYVDRFLKTLDQVRKNSEFRTIDIQGASGSWYRLRIIPLLIDKDNDVMILGEDISDEIEYTSTLKERENEYETLVKQLPSPITMVDQDDNFVYVNQKTVDLLGYSREEMLQMKNYEIAEEHNRFRAEVLRTYLDTNNLRTDIANLITKNGDVVTVEYSSININFHGQKVRLTVVNDLTERLEFQQEKERLLTKIAHDQRVESLGVFVGGIAHDFNNTLSALIGNAELMSMMLNQDSPDLNSVNNLLDRIREISENAAGLTSQLLAYAGRTTMKIKELDLNALIKNFSDLLSVSIKTNVELEYQLSDELHSILGDITQLQQYYLNIMTNASDAIHDTNPGKINISTYIANLNTDQVQFDFTIPSNGEDYAVLDIKDNGVGMSQNIIDNIFDPFYSTKVDGRGLGLAVVLGIVRSHNGALRIETEIGNGTSFAFYIPMLGDKRSDGNINKDSVPDYSDIFEGNVVIADDDDHVLLTNSEILSNLGFQVFQASNGEEVLKHLRTLQAVKFVLMDVTMPKLDGIATTRMMVEEYPELPIILMSGYSKVYDSINDLTKMDHIRFIAKPFKIKEIIELINLQSNIENQ